MTEVETAWLAGLLEGEGCFGARNLDTPKHRPSIYISLGMTDLDVMERARGLMGTSNLIRSDRMRSSKHKKCYRLWVGGLEAERVMRAVRPWMFSRRAEKIDYLLTLNASHLLR